jgi:DNA topoisomerase-1
VPGAGGAEETAPKALGRDPATGLEVTLRTGRFGPYVQLGEAVNGEKPKRSGLVRGTDPATVDLEMALKLLALPREVGRHPDDGEPIVASIGRFGPYVQHGKTYANLDAGDDVLNIGLNRAVTLIAEKVAAGPRGRRFGGDPGRSLGDHPGGGGPVLVKAGRYGPYVTYNGVNATLPRDKTPETITLDEAVVLITARAERVGEDRPRKGAKAAKGATKASKPAKTKASPSGKNAKRPKVAGSEEAVATGEADIVHAGGPKSNGKGIGKGMAQVAKGARREGASSKAKPAKPDRKTVPAEDASPPDAAGRPKPPKTQGTANRGKAAKEEADS